MELEDWSFYFDNDRESGGDDFEDYLEDEAV